MAIDVALRHRTAYRYDRLVQLGPQLIDHCNGDPQPGGFGLCRWRQRTSRREGRQQLIHALAHDRIEGWTRIGQLDPMARPQQGTPGDHAIHHRSQLSVGEGQWLPAAVATGASWLVGVRLSHQ